MAKAKKQKPVLVKIMLPPDIHQRLRSHATAGRQTVSQAVAELITNHAPDYEWLRRNSAEAKKLEDALRKK